MKLTLKKAKKMMDKSGGGLDLRGTQITALPDNLTVGGSLYLRGTQITALPDNLTVGGSLGLRGTQIKPGKYRKLQQGQYEEGRYLYADGILTHVKKAKQVGLYTFYIGKIKGKNVVTDGVNYAHCKSLKEGIADLTYKAAKERGAEQYKSIDKNKKIKTEDAVAMYRVITGACRQGTESFMNNLETVKESYSVNEIIKLTKGYYGHEVFSRFFEN